MTVEREDEEGKEKGTHLGWIVVTGERA